MTTGHEREFAVVDLVINEGGATAGVDAYTLAVIKTERQMRRLMTHAVFQSRAFERSDVTALRAILVDQRGIYFEHLRNGFEFVSGLAVAEVLGDQLVVYEAEIEKVRLSRNKLFHGQLTAEMLGTSELFERTLRLSAWSKLLGDACDKKFGYAGFDNSYFKEPSATLSERATELVPDMDAYSAILTKLQKRSSASVKPSAPKGGR